MLTSVIVSQNSYHFQKRDGESSPIVERVPCTQRERLHATCPFTCLARRGAARRAPRRNEVSRLTPTPNVFWAEKSLARTAAVHFRVPCRATRWLARSLWLVHVRGSPMQTNPTPTTIAVGSAGAPGFRVGFSPWKRRDCRGPAWPSEAWPVVRFFPSPPPLVLPSLFLLSSSPAWFSSLASPSHGSLFSWLCTPRARTRLLQSARAHIIIYIGIWYNFTSALSPFLFSLCQTGRTNFRFFMSKVWFYYIFISSNFIIKLL